MFKLKQKAFTAREAHVQQERFANLTTKLTLGNLPATYQQPTLSSFTFLSPKQGWNEVFVLAVSRSKIIKQDLCDFTYLGCSCKFCNLQIQAQGLPHA